MSDNLYIKSVMMKNKDFSKEEKYLSKIKIINNLSKINFNKPVTFFVGENGIGKSTLLEAIAVAYGFNAEGGSKNFNFNSKETHSSLYKYLTIVKNVKRPKDGFFLRSESFYNLATEIERLDEIFPLFSAYGEKSLHDQSHGEGIMSIILNRFNGNGIYILDEPEAALSPSKICSLIVRIDQLVKNDSQFIIATHSPLLIAYPNSEVFVFNENEIKLTPFEETEHYNLTKYFNNNPNSMIKRLHEKI